MSRLKFLVCFFLYIKFFFTVLKLKLYVGKWSWEGKRAGMDRDSRCDASQVPRYVFYYLLSFFFTVLIFYVGKWRWQGWKKGQNDRDSRCVASRVPGTFLYYF